MFFTEKNRKKNLIIFLLVLPLFCGALFLLQTHFVDAQGYYPGMPTATVQKASADAAGKAAGTITLNPFKLVFQWLLYGIFVVFGLLTSLAITIFEWAIKPDNVQLLFNSSGVYESWKFVRDFFNLFFILVLLYVAFKIVFQIEHDFKKTLLSIVLAALFINFSYPVSRVLIDVTNVPMYFFSNQMMARNPEQGTGVFGATMTASKMEGILLSNKGSNNEISRLLMAIVFMFLFSVTLLVLAVMFVIRLVALVILVIFSAVGFAASIVPGLEQYSKMWWDNFWKYAFFGPAAMLMLLVAMRFFASLSDGAIMKSMQTVATGNTAGLDQTFFSSMALFTIPIIMLWMAMGLAQKFSIAGADTVVGQGKKFSAWAGKAPFRAGWAGAKWGGRKIESKLAAKGGKWKYLSPTVIKEAWKARSEEQHHEDNLPIEMAKGQMHDDFNKGFNYLRSKSNLFKNLTHEGTASNEFSEQNKQVKHFEDQLKERSGGEINEATTQIFLKEAMKEHNRAKALAAMKSFSLSRGQDNIAGDFAVQMGIKANQDQVNIVEDYNATMRAMMSKLGIDDQSAMKHMHNFGENAKSKGDSAFGDLYKVNVDTGEFEENEDHAGTVGGNFKKGKAQTRQDIIHSRALFEQKVVPVMVKDPVTGADTATQKIDPKTKEPEWGREYEDLHESGMAIADAINNMDVEQAGRKNAVVDESIVKAFNGAKDHPEKYPNFIKMYNKKKDFREYVAYSVVGKNNKNFPDNLPTTKTPPTPPTPPSPPTPPPSSWTTSPGASGTP